jgi:hypothetical protein
MNMASNSSNLSFEFSTDSKAEIRNIFQDLAKEVVSEVMQNPIERKAYLNKKEAAKYIGCSYQTLQKLILSGMKTIQIDGKCLISKIQIDNFLQSIEK